MRTYAAILAAAALLVSTGVASAQSRNYDSSGAPKSSGSSPRSGGGLVDNSTTGSSGAMTAPNTTNAQPGDAGSSQAVPPPGPDNGGTLNPRAPSNAR